MPRQNLIPYALMLALTLLALGAAALAIAQGPATVSPAKSESVSVVCTTTQANYMASPVTSQGFLLLLDSA